jgi:hypothetical protein
MTTPSPTAYLNKIFCNICKGQYILINGDYIQCFCGVKSRTYLHQLEQSHQNYNNNNNKTEDIKMVKVCQSNGSNNSMQTVPLKEFRRMIGLKDNRRHNSIGSTTPSEISQQQQQQQLNRNISINSYNRMITIQQQQQQQQYNSSIGTKSLPVYNPNRLPQTRWQQPILNNKQTTNNKFFQQPQQIYDTNFIKNDQYNQFQPQQQFGYNGVSLDMRQFIPQTCNFDTQQSLAFQQQQQQFNLQEHLSYLTMQRYNQTQFNTDLQIQQQLSSSSSSSSSSSTSSTSSTVQQQQQQQQQNNVDNTNINNLIFSSAALYLPLSQQQMMPPQGNLPNILLSSLNDEIK